MNHFMMEENEVPKIITNIKRKKCTTEIISYWNCNTLLLRCKSCTELCSSIIATKSCKSLIADNVVIPVVFLHPLLQKHIEDKINSYKISYDADGEPTDTSAGFTKAVNSELLRIESLKRVLGDSGIEITIRNEADPATKEENDEDKVTIQTFYLTFMTSIFH